MKWSNQLVPLCLYVQVFGNVFQGIKHIISLLSCSHIQIFLFLYGIILFTAMAQLGSSLEGRLRNTDLPVTKCLFPVFEAVVNSIYAIDDRLKSDNSFSITEGKSESYWNGLIRPICLEEKQNCLVLLLRTMESVSPRIIINHFAN